MKKLKEYFDHKTTRICAQAGVTVIVTCVILFLLYQTGGFWSKAWSLVLAVLQPIVIGGILCYLMSPLVNRLEILFCGRKTDTKEKRWARPLSVLMTFLIVLAVVVLLLLLIVITVYRSVASVNLDAMMSFLSSTQNDLNAFLESAAERLSELGLSSEWFGSAAIAAVNGIKNAATSLLFGVIFSIYFLLDGKRIGSYWRRALRLLAGEKASKKLNTFTADADRVFSGYIRGQFVDALIVGELSSVALLIAGVPNGIIVGVLAGLGNLIPYVGPVIGFLTLVLVCIPTAAWGKLLAGAIILVVIMLVDSNLINPRLLSNNIKIHPLLVIAALIGGGALGGLAGMIVAVPLAALIKVQLDRYFDQKEMEST